MVYRRIGAAVYLRGDGTMSVEPRLAVVTFLGEEAWFARVAFVRVDETLVAGNDLITGEWFQCWAAHCTVTFDPQEVTA